MAVAHRKGFLWPAPQWAVHVPRILELHQNDTGVLVMAPRYGVGRLADTGRGGWLWLHLGPDRHVSEEESSQGYPEMAWPWDSKFPAL